MKNTVYIKMNMPRFLYPLYIEYKYIRTIGKWCHLIKPKTYTEKIQWSKLNRNNAILAKYTDKIAVRSFVAERIGEEYLVPVLGGCYKSLEEIDLSVLPKSFVIKANHGSGYNLIVKDKNTLDISKTKDLVENWLNEKFAFNLLELQYKDIVPSLYIEENLLKDDMNDLPDYKFFCFNGKVFCSYVMINTFPVHHDAKLGIFDRNFKLLPYSRADFKPIKTQIEKPENYEKMVELAEKLAEGFSHVRVDLYNVKGKIYFGEMTFSTESGFFKHNPEEFDRILGEQWDLSSGI